MEYERFKACFVIVLFIVIQIIGPIYNDARENLPIGGVQ
jgi:hypothetical protein